MTLRQMRERRRSNALSGGFTDSQTGTDVSFEERTGDQEEKVALYNLVEKEWGTPVPVARAARLAKHTVFACTARGCAWTSSSPNQHSGHVSLVDSQKKQHIRAES